MGGCYLEGQQFTSAAPADWHHQGGGLLSGGQEFTSAAAANLLCITVSTTTFQIHPIAKQHYPFSYFVCQATSAEHPLHSASHNQLASCNTPLPSPYSIQIYLIINKYKYIYIYIYIYCTYIYIVLPFLQSTPFQYPPTPDLISIRCLVHRGYS